jgi:hypothetical protein
MQHKNSASLHIDFVNKNIYKYSKENTLKQEKMNIDDLDHSNLSLKHLEEIFFVLLINLEYDPLYFLNARHPL